MVIGKTMRNNINNGLFKITKPIHEDMRAICDFSINSLIIRGLQSPVTVSTNIILWR